MKKQYPILLICILCLIWGVVSYVERHIESTIGEKFATFPMKIGKVEYLLLRNMLILHDVHFVYIMEDMTNDSISFSMGRIDINNCATALSDIDEEFPLIFEKMVIDNLLVRLMTGKKAVASMYVHTYTIWNYAHNLKKVEMEYGNTPFSEEFFKVLLHMKHNGIEKRGASFAFYSDNGIERELYMERAFLEPMDASQRASVHYEGVSWKSPMASIQIPAIDIENIAIPEPDALQALWLALQKDTAQAQSSVWQDILIKVFLKESFLNNEP